MKYDESKVNNAKVGDLVYGYNDLDDLKKAIEADDEETICKDIVLYSRTSNFFLIEDTKMEALHSVRYVYPIGEAAGESKLDRILRVLRKSESDINYRPAVIEQFFKLKRRGFIHSPATDLEEIALDWSYDLEEESDCDRLEKEAADLSIKEIAFLFSGIDEYGRYVFHDREMCLREIRLDDSVFHAVRNLLVKFYESIA